MSSLPLAPRVPVARRQLTARRGRTGAGVFGIAAALLLVLALKAIFAGMEERLTAYIDGSGADVIVAQEGVETMHMTQSALPAQAVSAVAAVRGVAQAKPIVYVPATVERGAERGIVYLIGDDAGGAPFPLTSGRRPRAGTGVDAEALAARIEESVPSVSASTRAAFAASERRVVGDMTTDIVRGMLVVGFVIGVAVAGLVSYAQTLTQLRDYGVLRALGLRGRGALALVFAQVAAMVIAGFVVAVALVGLLAAVLPALSPTLALSVRGGDVAQAATIAGAVALAAALVPLARVLRVPPAAVFRRGS
jgi:putative ABC transport system permease protein